MKHSEILRMSKVLRWAEQNYCQLKNWTGMCIHTGFLWSEQNGRHFADDMWQIVVKENFYIFMQISLIQQNERKCDHGTTFFSLEAYIHWD